jgi:FkbM family methyltransferase
MLATSRELRTIRGELALAQQRGLLSAALSQSGPIENETSKRHAQTGSMSQLGQDMWVIEKCKFKRGGYFVEFGATDGVLLSNTWLLEKKYGWTGICAEPNPEFFSRLKINRSCTVVDSCIGKNTGEEVEFIFADVYGGNEKHMSDDKHGDKRRLYRDLGRTAKLRTISLHDLLKEHEAPHTIDYISIDIEGGEYEVLSGFPFSSWDVRYLTIEHNFGARREDIFNIMTRNGYRRTEMKYHR